MARTTKAIRRSYGSTIRYGDSSSDPAPLSRNHTAGQEGRSLSQLKSLLCDLGERSDGGACKGCESSCRFGEEYLSRIEAGRKNR